MSARARSSSSGASVVAALRLPAWLSGEPGRWIVQVHAQPGGRRGEVLGPHGDALKVRIAAPPIEGRANQALLHWLAQQFGANARDLELLTGASGRAKRVLLRLELSAEQVQAALQPAAADSGPLR